MLSYAGAIKFEVRSEEARGRTLAKETMKEGRKELRKTDSEKNREKYVERCGYSKEGIRYLARMCEMCVRIKGVTKLSIRLIREVREAKN